MTYRFSLRSKWRLRGIHPDLRRVMDKAIQITEIDFTVLEGLRTPERQKQLFNAGASKIFNSRHLTGHAVDVAPYVGGKIRWDWPLYHELAPYIKKAAQIENVPIVWGGDWESFPDGAHFQLPRKDYV